MSAAISSLKNKSSKISNVGLGYVDLPLMLRFQEEGYKVIGFDIVDYLGITEETISYSKHETAIVDEGAKIGDGTRFWHWVHISSGAKIGVGNNIIIGNNCKVQNNVSIYDNVFLEDDVFCGASMVFTNVYNPRSAVVRKNEYRGKIVKRGVTIGANATIVCGVTLGEFSFVAARAVVNKDVRT